MPSDGTISRTGRDRASPRTTVVEATGRVVLVRVDSVLGVNARWDGSRDAVELKRRTAPTRMNTPQRAQYVSSLRVGPLGLRRLIVEPTTVSTAHSSTLGERHCTRQRGE